MALAYKLIPLFLAWAGAVMVLGRGFPGRRPMVAVAGSAGYAGGLAATFLLVRFLPGDLPFGIIKDAVGAGIILMWGVSVAAVYRSTGRDVPLPWGERFAHTRLGAGICALATGILVGAICACRFTGADASVPVFLLLVLAAVVLACAVLAAERFFFSSLTMYPSGMTVALVAFLLLSSSSILRLDLFSPLTMKVMKFAHDFVHQFFESMLIPDHFFFNSFTWDFIGFFFGKQVGFWGALIIWFVPVLLVALAVNLVRLPAVAHIRQGAQRRKMLAAAIRERRSRLVVPALAAVIFAAAVYQSRFPSVEYWDPKPVSVTASPSGEIFIPKKGEIDLEDEKLHKYLFKQGGREARFFVLMAPSGQWTVDLDACAICKPDGYGQAEGAVLCYYCRTLIPLDTVGKPGGCNPVPVPFTAKDDGIHIDGLTLINRWGETVQATTRIKETGK
ncbi:MAG: DUF2318 domain-containing protein [Oryzomonas sp.]|uniref:DUF2318 domain-containing protein n=1 Tax=Oryzomonas sp. TaxID=2855186 RepID=UPI00283E7BDA|nr:DUF2318 domain-containing protein [Oryzomonas sp.]MDR3581006.1 DUF2318 domain-containing protein [Oryzomonas sp.]